MGKHDWLTVIGHTGEDDSQSSHRVVVTRQTTATSGTGSTKSILQNKRKWYTELLQGVVDLRSTAPHNCKTKV